MDYIRPTPMENPLLGLLAERLKQAQGFVAKPFGYSNPPAEMLMNLLGIPAVQQTMERKAYGEPMTTGTGGIGGTTSGGVSHVPTKSSFTVKLKPMYSRNSARNFSLDRFVQGGYLNNSFGYI